MTIFRHLSLAIWHYFLFTDFVQAEISFQASVSASQKWRPAPTRREQEKWVRAAKAATGGSVCF